jgi:hypothetical protein
LWCRRMIPAHSSALHATSGPRHGSTASETPDVGGVAVVISPVS